MHVQSHMRRACEAQLAIAPSYLYDSYSAVAIESHVASTFEFEVRTDPLGLALCLLIIGNDFDNRHMQHISIV